MDMKDLKKHIDAGTAIFGAKESLKGIKHKTLKKVFISSDCQDDVKQDVQKYAEMNSIEVIDAGKTAEELGVLCKKPFSISIVGCK